MAQGSRQIDDVDDLVRRLVSGTITALVVQKNNKERVNVFLDDQFAFGVTVNVALILKKGQTLSDDEIAELKFNDGAHKAYERALRFLGYRPRSQGEVRQYLRKKEISEEVIDVTITRLEEQGYLDDAEFGRIWVENRVLLNPKGKRALQYELRQKGLADKDINKTLDGLDEGDLARLAVQKKLSNWQSLDELSFRKKLTGYLARRGFPYDVIQMIFEEVWQEPDL